MESALGFRIAYVTTNSLESAAHISRILVSENLAACCTVIPNTISFFSWSNSINERHECIIMIKTKITLVEKLCNRVTELHYDEVPEIITVSMEEASVPYLEWMKSTLAEH